MSRVTAITGGIGSGKSVVCNILRHMGYEVYDCDLRAKAIMDNDMVLKRQLSDALGDSVLNADDSLNRPALSAIVFGDPDKLVILNSLVHGAVRDDIQRWRRENEVENRAHRLFIETAILYQSGLDKMVDDIWEVSAPEDIRIVRVMRRNNLTAAQVRARIAAQRPDIPAVHPPTYTIRNDNTTPLLPQIIALL